MKPAAARTPKNRQSDGATPPLRRQAAITLGIAVAAAALTLFFFFPRIVYWRTLGVSQDIGAPETFRAIDTVAQLEHPFAPIDNPTNQVIGWRLLFPVVWHYVRLPAGLLFLMPYIGVVAALWGTAWLSYRRCGEIVQTFFLTALFAALPWFFVSTGWLCYFDSWLVIGLLSASFVPSQAALGAACLLTPWIDERFVFALPVVWTVRTAYFARLAEGEWRAAIRDALVIAIATIPYVAVRAIAWISGDAASGAYATKHFAEVQTVPAARFLEGLWSGYRAAWSFVGAAVWGIARRWGMKWAAICAALIVVTAIGALLIAADMSRTLTILSPFVLLGAWLWRDESPNSFRLALPLVLILNLLLPAQHVVWSFTVPIRYVYAEIDHCYYPPDYLRPERYVDMGNEMRRQGNQQDAAEAFDTALAFDPSFVPAYLGRAGLRLEMGDHAGAAADAARVLQIEPNSPDGLFAHAMALEAQGDLFGATADLQKAVSVAPREWGLRGQAEEQLERLLRRQEKPASKP